jgi:hypothetical protein
MSLEHSPNPFNNPEFRKEMSAMLDDKLHNVFNIQSDHDRRINSLERWRWYIVGGGTVLLFVLKLLAAR